MKSANANKKREIVMASKFLDDLRFWAETDRKMLIRVLDLIEAISRDPFKGIGKPEPLKRELSGTWSRRITQEHRIVYRVRDERIELVQARHHY